MSNVAVRVEGLGKRYRLGRAEERADSLVGAAVSWLRSPLQNYRELRELSRFDDDAEGLDVLWALRDVSFDVHQGEVLGIIGHNGAGKSTLLKILSRITEPTRGRVEMHGRVSSLLEVGTGFHPELTGRENVYLNGTLLGMTRTEIEQKFEEIVSFSGVERHIDTPVKRYSSGMNVRLAFSVAAHLEPEILLVDEVLAVGDAGFQKQCIGKMKDVAGEGRTVIFVSHDMAAVQNLCPRTILMSKGGVREDGPTTDVMSAYLASISEATRVPLVGRVDRRGKGDILFHRVNILDVNGRVQSPVRSGQKIIIRLHYSIGSKYSHKGVRFSISFNRMGRTYFVVSTELVVKDEIVITEPGYIDCVIDDLPLDSGEYECAIFCESDGEVQDWVDAAFSLPVIADDFFGTGRLAPKGHRGKYVLVRHEWLTHAYTDEIST